MFTWIPFYRDLAGALLPYRNRQQELVRVLRGLERDGWKVVSH